MKCENCKKKIPDDVSFCPYCGTVIPDDVDEEAPKWCCGVCGEELPNDAIVCPRCGEDLRQETDEGLKPVGKFCDKCGTAIPEGAAFCPECGRKRPERVVGDVIEYDINVPVLTTWPIISQVGIPFLLIGGLLAVIAIKGGDIRENIAFWVIGAFLLLSILVSLLLFHGKYDLHIRLDSMGVNVKTRKDYSKRTGIISFIMSLIFLFSRSGDLGSASKYRDASRLDAYIKWEDARKAKFSRGGKYIQLNEAASEFNKVTVFCAGNNYEPVAAFIRAKLPKTTTVKGE